MPVTHRLPSSIYIFARLKRQVRTSWVRVGQDIFCVGLGHLQGAHLWRITGVSQLWPYMGQAPLSHRLDLFQMRLHWPRVLPCPWPLGAEKRPQGWSHRGGNRDTGESLQSFLGAWQARALELPVECSLPCPASSSSPSIQALFLPFWFQGANELLCLLSPSTFSPLTLWGWGLEVALTWFCPG